MFRGRRLLHSVVGLKRIVTIQRVGLLRHGQRVTPLRDTRRQRRGVREMRLVHVEPGGNLLDGIRRFGQRLALRRGHRLAQGTQPLQPAFQRCQQRFQHRDVDHGDGAMQGMHRTQQFLVGGDVAAGGRRHGGADGGQVLGHLAAQNVDQHRIHRRQRGHRQRRHVRIRRVFVGGILLIAMLRDIRLGRGGDRITRYAPTYSPSDGFGGDRRFEHRLGIALGQAIGNPGDGHQRRPWRTFALQRAQQLGQSLHGVAHQRLHGVGGLDGAVQHAVQHVFDLPAELAQHFRPDQPAGALQGVEGAPDRRQTLSVVGSLQPSGKTDLDGIDFLLHFFQEDLADFVVDVVRRSLETRPRGHRVGHRDLLFDDLLDLDPVGIVRPGGRRRRLVGIHAPVASCRHVPGRRLRLIGRQLRLTGIGRGAGILSIGRVGDGGLEQRDIVRGGRRHHVRHGVSARRHRPVAELVQALLGDVQDVPEATAMLACGLQVVFNRGQRVGQLVHLRRRRNALVDHQFVVDEATDAAYQLHGAPGIDHGQRTANLVQAGRRVDEPGVVPRRFHERDQHVLDPADVADRLAHQRGQHLARLAARQGRAIVLGLAVMRAEPLDMVVQRCLDIEQRTGDIQQHILVHRSRTRCHVLDDAALLAHDAAWHVQTQHAKRVADPVQYVGLPAQLGRIAVEVAQIQVQRILDVEQVVLDGLGHRVEQFAVVSGHGAAGMFDFDRVRQQLLQPVGIAHLVETGAAALGARHVVQELVRQLHRLAIVQRVLTVLDEGTNATVDTADQLLHLAAVLVEHALAQAVQHAGRDPPQAASDQGVAAGRQQIQGIAHAVERGVAALTTEPGQQRLLESHTQRRRFLALFDARQRLGRRRRLGRQRRAQVRPEQLRLVQYLGPATGAQVVQQWQQHHRDVAITALQALEVIGHLHHAAHQRGVGVIGLGHFGAIQGADQLLHFLHDGGRTIELDHAQRSLHLMQLVGALLHEAGVVGAFDIRLQRLACTRQGLVQLGLDPIQRGEIDVVFQSHAPSRPLGEASKWSEARYCNFITACVGHPVGRVTAASAAAAPGGREHPAPTRDSFGCAAGHPGSLKSATERRRSLANCARLPIDSAVWLAPSDVCEVIS